MNNRTPAQTALIVLGSLVLVAGVVCVGLGFVRFASADPSDDVSGSMGLFLGGGLGMVVGLGIVAFTRAAVLRANGGYRITIEEGAARSGGRFCSSCGRPTSMSARFCDSCGAAVG
jgi:hypothetical protein